MTAATAYDFHAITKPIRVPHRARGMHYYHPTNINSVRSVTISYRLYGFADREQRFARLAEIWKTETVLKSNMALKAMHPAYQKIIGMGKAALPFMLKDFQRGTFEDWFWALQAIAGDEAPSTANVAGNVKAMAEIWVAWGKTKSYL
jgi:hypothetical protein